MENNVYYFFQFRSNAEFRRKEGSYDFNSVKFIFINLKLYIT